MNATLKNQIEKTLGIALSDFANEDDALEFFREFLTKKEFIVLSKRLSVVYYLSKKRNYANIQNNLKVSSATVAEARELVKKSAIRKVIKKIDADIWATTWSSRIKGLLK